MLSPEALERLFDELAIAIDHAGPEQESMLLTKLAFLLAHRVGDENAVREAIAQALEEIPDATADTPEP